MFRILMIRTHIELSLMDHNVHDAQVELETAAPGWAPAPNLAMEASTTCSAATSSLPTLQILRYGQKPPGLVSEPPATSYMLPPSSPMVRIP